MANLLRNCLRDSFAGTAKSCKVRCCDSIAGTANHTSLTSAITLPERQTTGEVQTYKQNLDKIELILSNVTQFEAAITLPERQKG